MNRTRALLLALFASTLVFGAAQATKSVPLPRPILGAALGEKETERYLDLAVQYSRYSKPLFARPKIDLVDPLVFALSVCGKPECSIVGYTNDEERDVVHIVSSISAEITARLGWTHDEIIVHELVHWLQLKAGVKFPADCAAREALELEAYSAQYQYAVAERKEDRPFWMPPVYKSCMEWKLTYISGKLEKSLVK